MTGGEPDVDGGRVGHRAVDAAGPLGDHRRGRILSARRGLISAGAGLAAGAVVGVLGAPELVPLVTWTVAASTVLFGVWRISRWTPRAPSASRRRRATPAPATPQRVA
jgi:hypothetical protein